MPTWITASVVFFLLCAIYSESSPVRVTGDTPPHRSWFQISLPSPKTYTWGARGYNDLKPHVPDLLLLGLHLLSVTSLSLYSGMWKSALFLRKPNRTPDSVSLSAIFHLLGPSPLLTYHIGLLAPFSPWGCVCCHSKHSPLLISLSKCSLHYCYMVNHDFQLHEIQNLL